MINFLKQLSLAQWKRFFGKWGSICNMEETYDRIIVYVISNQKEKLQFIVDDTSIISHYLNLGVLNEPTDEEWRLFLQGVFGEKYVRGCGIEPAMNTFISQLSLRDIRYFFWRKRQIIETIEELRAFRKGTRRFRITFHSPTYTIKEIVMGPLVEYCSGFQVTEKMFNSFMAHRFGQEFYQYYKAVEQDKLNTKLEKYRIAQEERFRKKIEYVALNCKKSSEDIDN